MEHALAEQHFDSCKEFENWVSDCFASKDKQFYWYGVHKLPERWRKCVASNNILINILNTIFFIFPLNISVLFSQKNAYFILVYLVGSRINSLKKVSDRKTDVARKFLKFPF